MFICLLMFMWQLEESTVMAKGSKGGGGKSRSGGGGWGWGKSKSKSKSSKTKVKKPKANYYPGTPIFIWTTGPDGVSYQSTSDLCPIQYCTIEGDDGLERCGSTEECEKAMSHTTAYVLLSILGVIVLAIAVRLMWYPCKKCMRCGKGETEPSDPEGDFLRA